MIVVKATDLNKIYNKSHALKDFNITINKGDIYGLIGVNGAGKTTSIGKISNRLKKAGKKVVCGVIAKPNSQKVFHDEINLAVKGWQVEQKLKQ